jgi:hypothetical protein
MKIVWTQEELCRALTTYFDDHVDLQGVKMAVTKVVEETGMDNEFHVTLEAPGATPNP